MHQGGGKKAVQISHGEANKTKQLDLFVSVWPMTVWILHLIFVLQSFSELKRVVFADALIISERKRERQRWKVKITRLSNVPGKNGARSNDRQTI